MFDIPEFYDFNAPDLLDYFLTLPKSLGVKKVHGTPPVELQELGTSTFPMVG